MTCAFKAVCVVRKLKHIRMLPLQEKAHPSKDNPSQKHSSVCRATPSLRWK